MNQKKKITNKHVLASVGKQYDVLRLLCIEYVQPGYRHLFDDIFHDTILLVSQDKVSSEKKTDNELKQHFVYRFKMITYRTIKNTRQLKETDYADNKQTKEEKE
jgi:hypothetical protein